MSGSHSKRVALVTASARNFPALMCILASGQQPRKLTVTTVAISARCELQPGVLFQMLGMFAEFARALIAERVAAGLARARARGKRCHIPFARGFGTSRAALIKKQRDRAKRGAAEIIWYRRPLTGPQSMDRRGCRGSRFRASSRRTLRR